MRRRRKPKMRPNLPSFFCAFLCIFATSSAGTAACCDGSSVAADLIHGAVAGSLTFEFLEQRFKAPLAWQQIAFHPAALHPDARQYQHRRQYERADKHDPDPWISPG